MALVLAGHMQLERTMKAHPQLHSRMVAPVVLSAVAPEDVAAFAAGLGIADPANLRQLEAAARLPGRLRNVANLLRIAAGGAEAGKPITRDGIAWAIQRMRLAVREEA